MSFHHELDEYVKNKSWYWYAPFWLFGLYLFIKLLDFKLAEPAPSFFIMIAQSLDFFLHEIAHLLTAFFPALITASAGSGAELLLGLVLIVTAFFTRSYFASLFCFLWFMLTTQATADYMADASTQQIPLVSFGGSDPTHDWNFIFSKLGLLEQDTFIAGITRGIGILAGLFGLGFSLYLLVRIHLSKHSSERQAVIDELMDKRAGQKPGGHADKPFIGGDLYPSPEIGPLATPKPEEKQKLPTSKV